MLTRRPFLAFPLLAALPSAAFAAVWSRDIGEVRFGAPAGECAPLASQLQSQLGVPVRPARLDGAALAKALNAGHVEFALLDAPALAQARMLMGGRLIVMPGAKDGRTAVVRRALPDAMRTALASAIA